MAMQQKMTFAGIAALALAAAMTAPGYAAVHHRVHHRTAHQSDESTPAERQQTADLNRQQLAQAQAGPGSSSMGTNVGSASMGTANQQNGLATESTSYRRGGTSSRGAAGMNGSAPSSMGSQPGSESGAVQTPANTAPDAGPQSNPDGTTAPPPANPPGGTQ
jgi:hypothetical protein